MFRELGRWYTKKLNIVLHSKLFYFLLFSFLILYLLYYIKLIPHTSNYSAETTEVTGIIKEYSQKNQGIEIIISINKKENMRIITKKNNIEDFHYHDLIKVKGNIKPISKNTIPNTFNYQKYLFYQKIYYTMESNEIIVLKKSNFIYQWKTNLKNFVAKKKFANYYQLFILGSKEKLDKNIYQTYQKNGISHLFVISGMHLSFLNQILKWIGKKFIKNKNVIEIFCCFFLLSYGFIIVWSPSVARSLLFFSLKSMNTILDLKLSQKKIFLLTIFLLLLFCPFYIYFVSFQFTALITFGLIFFSKNSKNYWKNTIHISLIAFLFSIPILAANFYEINFLSIIMNFIMVPFVTTIFFPLTIVSFLLPIFEPFLSIVIKTIEGINQIGSNVNIFTLILPKIAIYWYLFYYIFLSYFYQTKNKFSIFIFFFSLFFWHHSQKFDSSAYYYFFDVGQGDSAFLIAPYQKEKIMIDTGGSIYNEFSISDNIILFFKSIGVHSIDILYLSHGDADHLLETENILKKITVKKIMFNQGKINELEQNINSQYPEKIEESYTSKNFKITDIKHLEKIFENDNSRILHICIRNFCSLFMGDASKIVETEIIKNYKIKTDIIKIGHHGSKTSSSEDFLKKINPEQAIISAGKNNIYHHPHPSVVETLKKQEIKTYLTNVHGTIKYKISKKTNTIFTFPP